MGPRRALDFEIGRTTDCRTLKYLNITDEFTTYYNHPLKHRSLNRRTRQSHHRLSHPATRRRKFDPWIVNVSIYTWFGPRDGRLR